MENNNMQKVTVLKAFRDKDDFGKLYVAGNGIEFTKERAGYLKKLGLVDFDESQDFTGGTIGTIGAEGTIDLTAGCQKTVSEVRKCNDPEELEKALIAETNGKNRKLVVEALEDRITKLQPSIASGEAQKDAEVTNDTESNNDD